MNTAEQTDVGDDLVENVDDTSTTETEPDEVSLVNLIVEALNTFGIATAKKTAAQAEADMAEATCQEALGRLYELTDEGDAHLSLPHGKFRVKKKRGRVSGFVWAEVTNDKEIDLSAAVPDDFVGDDEDDDEDDDDDGGDAAAHADAESAYVIDGDDE